MTRTFCWEACHSKTGASSSQSEEWLLAQANVLVIAGSDTTATALTTLIYYLAAHQDKLWHLQQELREAFDEVSEMTSDRLQGMPYLNAVIEEGLRICPPTSFGLPRISPGAMSVVSTSSWTTAHCNDYLHDARGFHPERWLPAMHAQWDAKFQNDHLAASKLFSLGPRGCLGIDMAYMEMRITLAKLAWKFNWELVNVDHLDWEGSFALKAFQSYRFRKFDFTRWTINLCFEIIQACASDSAAAVPDRRTIRWPPRSPRTIIGRRRCAALDGDFLGSNIGHIGYGAPQISQKLRCTADPELPTLVKIRTRP
ncbi:cytochrome P450 [Aspergillus homomorphus CBS 101889]|uniref:Cytochrome P450 n=1 Tax=Aspergillus homomorphus (strain CBS 101889) TaxID=1450537 RepID=A0A395I047_ASPHC|nr:cytochrome P450 [Aspergillus homomorphus CBS 101889]RAL13059.1 cytochrome P450 [Aspergillus homomorphus CBS 101889]